MEQGQPGALRGHLPVRTLPHPQLVRRPVEVGQVPRLRDQVLSTNQISNFLVGFEQNTFALKKKLCDLLPCCRSGKVESFRVESCERSLKKKNAKLGLGEHVHTAQPL